MRVILDGKNIEVGAATVNDLLRELKINPETVVVSKNREIVAEDEQLQENDNIRLIRVTSGG